jgi:hypothetical protein
MDQQQHLEALQDIKRMMERSSRFISLSGWSGIAAGCCALEGAWLARREIDRFYPNHGYYNNIRQLEHNLVYIAAGVFIGALVLAFLFTWLRSRRHQIPVWSATTRRLMLNTLLPIAAGGLVILRMLQLNDYALIAPCCLIFYGLGLVNGSKYTLGEVRYLGYAEIVLGIISLWTFGNGLLFWSVGFGFLHIVYGAVMWWKYERK